MIIINKNFGDLFKFTTGNERLSAETIKLAALHNHNQQMQCFQDQMAQMRSDLHAGLVQLEKVNNNAETVGKHFSGILSQVP